MEVEVVPGITAVLAAAAVVQVPLTHRDVSSTVILVTGSSKHSDHIANWPDRLPSNATLVVYMPGHDLGILQQRLMFSGVAPETPCAIISGATSEAEQVYITSVSNLFVSPKMPAPRLLVIGEVVRFASRSHLQEQLNRFNFSLEGAEVSSSSREKTERKPIWNESRSLLKSGNLNKYSRGHSRPMETTSPSQPASASKAWCCWISRRA